MMEEFAHPQRRSSLLGTCLSAGQSENARKNRRTKFNTGTKTAKLIQPGNPAFEQINQNGNTVKTAMKSTTSSSIEPGAARAIMNRSPKAVCSRAVIGNYIT